MKKCASILFLMLYYAAQLYANHIRGGELYYKYLGVGSSPNSSRYQVTLKLYIDCFQNNPGQNDEDENFTVYEKGQTNPLLTANAPKIREEQIRYDPASNPCITNPPTDVCYNLRYYQTSIELPDSRVGYTIAFQRCCRLDGIQNVSNSGRTGVTYLCEIPGTDVLPGAQKNSSPTFVAGDAVAICMSSAFKFNFGATDPDGTDSLSYSLCDAYDGAGERQGTCFTCVTPNPAPPPPYSPLPYRPGYSGDVPMDPSASIDAKTGIFSGIAPSAIGQYVVTVCVSEYRKRVLINVHRKDIHIKVSDCVPLNALLSPEYHFCDDFKVAIKNNQNNPPGTMYIWNYGDKSKPDTSYDPSGNVTHTYADTGVYQLKLTALLSAGQCIDSTTAIAKVFPGFFAGFTTLGTCILNPIRFVDTTKAKYGVVNKWSWAFGDETASNDSSHVKNPSWKYSTSGTKSVQLIVESSKGCIDTVNSVAEVKEKPTITLPFRDTLICNIDTLPLIALGFGIFNWTPNVINLMRNGNTANPLVFPKTTTTFYVQLNEDGCINNDSIKVRVTDRVRLNAGNDTTICLTDAIVLHPQTDGLRFEWTPAATLSDSSKLSPTARPTGTTVYEIIARIGKCSAKDDVAVTTVPYPLANPGPDTVICYRDTAYLHATIDGISYAWSPITALINPQSLNPLAYPIRTTVYTLTVHDNKGCPKPGIGTITVTVRPPVIASAGNDTSIVVNQPLQLNATGAEFYQWTPPTGLNNADIQNPIANISQNMTYVVKAYTADKCYDYDTINIKVFTTLPDIFVPNAFTPERASNNLFRPIPVGIRKLDYFRVYNRWGQLVYNNADPGKGWDGTINGNSQGPDTYVWMVQGTSYTGQVIFRKGTVVLMR